MVDVSDDRDVSHIHGVCLLKKPFAILDPRARACKKILFSDFVKPFSAGLIAFGEGKKRRMVEVPFFNRAGNTLDNRKEVGLEGHATSASTGLESPR